MRAAFGEAKYRRLAALKRAFVQVVREAGVGHIWSTDSVPHESNCIGLAGLLAAALHQL